MNQQGVEGQARGAAKAAGAWTALIPTALGAVLIYNGISGSKMWLTVGGAVFLAIAIQIVAPDTDKKAAPVPPSTPMAPLVGVWLQFFGHPLRIVEEAPAVPAARLSGGRSSVIVEDEHGGHGVLFLAFDHNGWPTEAATNTVDWAPVGYLGVAA